MRRVPLRLALLASSLCGILVPTTTAQSGPGLPGLVFDQSELFKIIATIGSGATGHAFLHDGYVAVPQVRQGFDFYDFSNPYAPVLVSSLTTNLGESRASAQTTAYGGSHVVLMTDPVSAGGTSIEIWDWTDVFNPRRESKLVMPGVAGTYTSGLFFIFPQAPYVYCPVGIDGLNIVDASNPQQPVIVKQIPKTRLGGFNTVNAIAVGNMLILTNSDSGPGFARLDISDPLNPVLLNSTQATVNPYTVQVNGGNLLVPVALDAGPILGGFHVHRIDQGGFPLVNRTALPGRGASAMVQDQFVHVGASASYMKIDIGNPASYRVVGSTPNNTPNGDSDWVSPMGNFVTLADDPAGTHIIPHRTLPDTTGPEVNMVVPEDGATEQALTSRVGITLTDMIEFESIGPSTFTVRPAGGSPLSGAYTSQFGIINFSPDQPLLAGTTYEVVVPAGGLRDWSGNPVTTSFSSSFTTKGTAGSIEVTARINPPSELGEPTLFDVASVSGQGPFQFSWDFGDGTPPTAFSSSSSAIHTYAGAGHYSALVTVTNGSEQDSDSFVQTVHYPITPVKPTRSSTIVLDEARGRVWCVNADNDTVTAIDAATLQKLFEVPVSAHPRTLAQAPDGTIWVVCQGADAVEVLDPQNGQVVYAMAVRYGSAPFGIAMSPDGRAAYVTMTATSEVAKFNTTTRTWVGARRVGPQPRWIAVSADSQRVFVTRFVSSSDTANLPAIGALGRDVLPPRPGAEVYEIAASTFSLARKIPLAFDPGPDTENSGRGLPNYLGAPAISPDGRRLWVPSKKDNIERGLFRGGRALNFESTVRTIVSQIDLASSREDLSSRVDFNDRDMAFAVAFSPLGDYAFHALQGSNAVEVLDAYTGDLVAAIEGTGLAPQGLCLTSDGATLFVHNFMSRSVSAHDTSGVTASTAFTIPSLGSVSTVQTERLSPQVLQGKQIFYNANDPRMSKDSYISCASCHLEGGHDGRVWDFTHRGEGLRNTVSMIGKAGIGHGNVHWTGNFDEIQDFENDIREAFSGTGFMSNAQFNSGTVSNPLGQPKGGLSPELDALAAYVGSLTAFGRSPARTPQGQLSSAGQRGKAVFQQLSCAQCHSGPAFTDSATGALHDVGTITPASGQRIGGPLLGFDTPTLRGLWATAPYLHDGSAATLMDVLTTRNPQYRHGATSTLTEQQRRDLVVYLLQIDDLEGAPQ